MIGYKILNKLTAFVKISLIVSGDIL